MEENRLDLMAPKEKQLRTLVPYLEEVAKGRETNLSITTRSTVLVQRILKGWANLATKERGITPRDAFLYYKKLVEEK